MLRFLSYLILACLPLASVGQNTLSDVDKKEVRFKKVRRFIKRQVENKCEHISDVRNTANKLVDIEFITHEQIMNTSLSVDALWESYVHSNPVDTWNDRKQSIAMMADRSDDRIYYPDMFENEVKKGQIFYYNLRLLGGFVRLAVAFEITEVNHKTHTISYSYIEGGKTMGTQSFTLKDDGHGGTVVYHTSNFSTGTLIRSRILYPYFHTRLVKDLHHRIWNYTSQEVLAAN